MLPMSLDDELLTDEGAGLPIGALVVAAVFLAVLVVGVRAIRRQREEGRRSKLPPIG